MPLKHAFGIMSIKYICLTDPQVLCQNGRIASMIDKKLTLTRAMVVITKHPYWVIILEGGFSSHGPS